MKTGEGVYGVSSEDVVIAIEIEGRLQFQEIAIRGGHSTYRILVKDPSGYESEGFRKLWARLLEIGCSHEIARLQWIAIDVPPESDIFIVYKLLEEGFSDSKWAFEEAHCGNPRVQVE